MGAEVHQCNGVSCERREQIYYENTISNAGVYPLLRDVGMASKTLTGFGIKLRIYWDFGTGCHILPGCNVLNFML